jgi:dTDP-4-dehydrorhamnose reductase
MVVPCLPSRRRDSIDGCGVGDQILRILILGAGGMLGHKLCQQLRGGFDVWGTVRSNGALLVERGIVDRSHLVEQIDAANFDSIVDVIARCRPDAVVNCIGIVKQLAEARDPVRSLSINALFPQRLAVLCRAAGVRLIHVSTDCVFSGRKGRYVEEDVSDAEDLYGRSKFLGEVADPPALTLRTSIIGREPASTTGLVEWFLSNRGKRIRGFTRAIFSGLTTLRLAEVVRRVFSEFPALTGLYHVASHPISKYDLLLLLRDELNVDVEIQPADEVILDRSLQAARLLNETGITPPAWPEMIRQMRDDPTPYDQWRASRVS